jgi:hypothetical protein
VLVTFKASDNPGGSGVARTEYSLDGGVGWATGTQAFVIADPLSHIGDGTHVILYRSVDVAGNVEAQQTCVVKIDTSKPTATARRLPSVRRGRTASLKYAVTDGSPNGGTADVVILVKRPNGAIVKRISVAQVTVNKPLVARSGCSMLRGTYRIVLSGKDAAAISERGRRWSS